MIADRKNVEQIHWIKNVQIKYNVDIAVIGGGIAGTIAACNAAMQGNSVVLIEQFAFLGGNGTVGGVTGFCGETRGVGRIFDEIIENLQNCNAIEKYKPQGTSLFRERSYDIAILAVVLQEICLRYGVKLLLHTKFIDSIAENNEIRYVLVSGKSGIDGIKAKIYIDCSGEAELSFSAGCPTIKGGENNPYQLPMSLNFFVRKTNRKKMTRFPSSNFKLSPYVKRADLPMTSIRKSGICSKNIKIKVPMFDSTQTESLVAAEIEGHRKMMRVLEFFQTHRKKKWELDHCASIIGIREGRRILGEYYLTVEDLRKGSVFYDAIAVGTFPLDGHKPDDDKRTYILPRDQLKVPPYHIPIRCLVPKGWKNLIVAGRCLSADQLALSSARVMTTCAMMGQAAGITARLAILKEMNCLDLIYKEYQEIIVEIHRNGAILDIKQYKKGIRKIS